MGLMRWIARRGAVGGTARWAAKGYKSFCSKDPNISGPRLYEALIKVRYAALPNAEHEQALIGGVENMKGLRGLVVAVLTVEAGFDETEPRHQSMFMDVIDEELKKLGTPDKITFGLNES